MNSARNDDWAVGSPAGEGELASWRVQRVLNRGGWANGDVVLCARDGEQAVLKTYARRPGWIRLTLGRWLIARERRAYERLDGLPGVAGLLDGGDHEALLVQSVAGDPISFRINADNIARVYARLRRCVQAMHDRGVFHLDLRNRGNVLVDEYDRPTVVDFASAARLNPDGVVGKLIGAALRAWDFRGLRKWASLDAAQEKPADWP